jgi:hypothetical protein
MDAISHKIMAFVAYQCGMDSRRTKSNTPPKGGGLPPSKVVTWRLCTDSEATALSKKPHFSRCGGTHPKFQH